MDDVYAIELAKTEYREGFNAGDVDRVLANFAPGFSDFSAGQPTFFGTEAREALTERLKKLFAVYRVRLFVQTIQIHTADDFAVDWGWHKLWLTPKAGGPPRYMKLRCSNHWHRIESAWKIVWQISAPEYEPRMTPVDEAEIMTSLSTESNAPFELSGDRKGR